MPLGSLGHWTPWFVSGSVSLFSLARVKVQHRLSKPFYNRNGLHLCNLLALAWLLTGSCLEVFTVAQQCRLRGRPPPDPERQSGLAAHPAESAPAWRTGEPVMGALSLGFPPDHFWIKPGFSEGVVQWVADGLGGQRNVLQCSPELPGVAGGCDP